MKLCVLVISLWTFFQNPLLEYQWKNRLVVINCGQNELEYQKQIELFASVNQQVKERDIKLILIKNQIARMPDDSKIIAGELLDYLDIDANGFQVVLVGKDGGTKFTSSGLTSPSTIFALIDGMPMRRQEMKRQQRKKY